LFPITEAQKLAKGWKEKSGKMRAYNKSLKKIEIVIEPTRTGYSAYALKYPVYTTGKSFLRLRSNIIKAFRLYFGDDRVTGKHLKLKLDLPQFFAFYKVINAKALSERIGMHQSLLAQYISGNKKPSPDQTRRILGGIREVGRELSDIEFFV
jgi:hypothetical protein